jgi:hypothetical protein
MNGVYGDPVDVKARADGRPTTFVWQGRRYTVRAILEHWVIIRDWWRDPQAAAGEPELEFWRVEVSLGQAVTPGVHELCREIATGAWTVRRSIT